MASIDTKKYLADGGYLQKGANGNLGEADLGNEAHDLLPSRYEFWDLGVKDIRTSSRDILTHVSDGTAMKKSFSLKDEQYFLG